MRHRGMRGRLKQPIRNAKKKRGRSNDRPSPDSPFKQSGHYPFVTIGGGGMLVQPAIRSESSATSARASFFLAVPSLDLTHYAYRPLARSSSAEKPHCGADFSAVAVLERRELCPATIAKLLPVLMNVKRGACPERALQICRIRQNLYRVPHKHPPDVATLRARVANGGSDPHPPGCSPPIVPCWSRRDS